MITPERFRCNRTLVGIGAVVAGGASVSMLIDPRGPFDIVAGISATVSLVFLGVLVLAARIDGEGRLGYRIPAPVVLTSLAVIGVGAITGYGAAIWRNVSTADTVGHLVGRVILTTLIAAVTVYVGTRIGRRIRSTPVNVEQQ